jgi:uncharacterized protein YjbJ (UPF0337 family)
MSALDKAKNAAEDLGGKAKETVGKATDDKSLQAEGAVDQAIAHAKDVGEKVEDTIKDVAEKVEDVIKDVSGKVEEAVKGVFNK